MRIALVAPTAADARDVMVLGESGIVAMSPPWFRPLYEPSKRRLVWPNGARPRCIRPRSPTVCADRSTRPPGAMSCAAGPSQQETWDMLMFGLRLGNNPRVFISTTPGRSRCSRHCWPCRSAPSPRATTFDNAANLAKPFIEEIAARYKGTRLGRQELEGELLEDVEGALWTRAMLEQARTNVRPLAFKRIIVGLDPSGGGGSAQGIVVAGSGRRWALLRAGGCLLSASPERWAERVVAVYDRHQADKVVLERNYRR